MNSAAQRWGRELLNGRCEPGAYALTLLTRKQCGLIMQVISANEPLKMPYQLVVFDIDGVITDGTITVNAAGAELKSVSFRTLDALSSFKHYGVRIAAVTGEDTPLCRFFEKRINWDAFLAGRKDKETALREVADSLAIPLARVVYVGDGKYDVPAIRMAALGLCPQDACLAARMNADIILKNKGGNCVEEVLEIVSLKNRHPSCPGFLAAYTLQKIRSARFLFKLPWCCVKRTKGTNI